MAGSTVCPASKPVTKNPLNGHLLTKNSGHSLRKLERRAIREHHELEDTRAAHQVVTHEQQDLAAVAILIRVALVGAAAYGATYLSLWWLGP